MKILLSLLMITGILSAGDIMNYAADEITAKELYKKTMDENASFMLVDIRETEQSHRGEIYADDTCVITRGYLEIKMPINEFSRQGPSNHDQQLAGKDRKVPGRLVCFT